MPPAHSIGYPPTYNPWSRTHSGSPSAGMSVPGLQSSGCSRGHMPCGKNDCETKKGANHMENQGTQKNRRNLFALASRLSMFCCACGLRSRWLCLCSGCVYAAHYDAGSAACDSVRASCVACVFDIWHVICFRFLCFACASFFVSRLHSVHAIRLQTSDLPSVAILPESVHVRQKEPHESRQSSPFAPRVDNV